MVGHMFSFDVHTLITQKSKIFYCFGWPSAHWSDHWVNLRQRKQTSSVSQGLLTFSRHQVHGITKMLCPPMTLLHVSSAKRKGWNSPFFHDSCKTSDLCPLHKSVSGYIQLSNIFAGKDLCRDRWLIYSSLSHLLFN